MTNPSTVKPADPLDFQRGDAPEGTEYDTIIHYTHIPRTEEELYMSRPPVNSRLPITKISEAFAIGLETGFE